ncbi:AzlD domain-containing protein [Janthinobacterium sp. LB2P70]|uniref:AzlD domain-containing protein n=1 Tax=Janthinobacterium TaxID=29580 RepID=UPI000E05C23B|nr:Predicted membrane protein [Janthinobacterium lividum]
MIDGIDLGRADVWIAIAVLVVATAATRSTFWLIGHHITIPRRVGEMLRYAPACALAAIIAPDLLMEGQQVHFELSNLKLLSGIAATLFFVIRRNMLQTIVFGMLVFTGLRLLHVFQ